MGKEYVAEGLVEAFAAHDLQGKRILLPRAAVARDLLPAGTTPARRAGGCGGSLSHGDSGGRGRARAGDLRRTDASRTGSRSPVHRP